MSFGLGSGEAGFSVGHILLSAHFPSTNLTSPGSLRFVGAGPSAVATWGERGWLRQVRTPVGLLDVVPTATNNGVVLSYELRFYDESALSTNSNSGLYALLPGATAFSTWRLSNPDSSGLTTHQLWLIHIVPGQADRARMFYFDSATTKWTLSDDSTTRSVRSWENTVPGTTKTEHWLETVDDGNLVGRTGRVYDTLNGRSVLVQTVDGAGMATNLTTYTYYDSSAAPEDRYRLKQIDYSDGRWTIHKYDIRGRVIRKYSALGDSAPTTMESDCITEEFAYSLTVNDDGVSDSGFWAPERPRKELRRIRGHESSRTLRTIAEDQTVEALCPLPGALWSNANNVVTATTRLTNALDYGRPSQIIHPDATRTLYTYSHGTDGSFTTTVRTGAYSGGNVTDGTETVTVLGPAGELLSRTTTDLASATPISRELYAYTDDLRKSYEAVSLNGRTNTVQYGCCGIESQIDWDDTITSFEYDALGRQVASIRHSVITTNLLDAAGRVLVRKRLASGMPDQVLDQFAYDSLGRTIAHTNALNGVTTFSEGLTNSKLHKLTTYPEGGQRLEVYCRDGQLERVTNSAAYPIRYVHDVEQDNGVWRETTWEIKTDTNGGTNEWTKTYTDAAGRSYKTVYAGAGAPYSERIFSFANQLIRERDPDDVRTLYGYNSRGEREFTVADLDKNSSYGWATIGTDRIQYVLRDVTTYSGTPAVRTRTYVQTNDTTAGAALISTALTSTDGLKSWQIRQRDANTAVVTSTVTAYSGNGTRTETVTQPDGTSTTRTFLYGRLSSVVNKDSGGLQTGATSYTYNSSGQLESATDARNGVTRYAYDAADHIVALTAPDPGTGEPAQITRTFYDREGRNVGQQLPDGTTTTNQLFPNGLLKKTWGSRNYPVEYAYDPQGRLRTMTTWQDFTGNAGTAVTTWNYDPYRGWLASKDYPNAATGAAGTAGPTYTYTPSGRLATRLWERDVAATYNCGNGGDLTGITYSGATGTNTPSVTFTYDRRGRRSSVQWIEGGVTRTLAYILNDADQPLTETWSGGTFDTFSMNRTFDTALRLQLVDLKQSGTSKQSAAYIYDATTGRLKQVMNGQATAQRVYYEYEPNSRLVSSLVFTNGANASMVTRRTHDRLNRLRSIGSQTYNSSGQTLGSPVSFRYGYNDANQRTRVDTADGSYWLYTYDELGQVTSGKRFWADGTPVAGQHFEYGFDDIGNRTATAGRASAVSTYSPNRLNQYQSRTVAGAVDVLGVANPTQGVTVNGTTATRRGEYFHHALSVANSTAQYPTITTVSAYGTNQTSTGRFFVPAATESFQHDADGNLTQDGRWTYSWDAENRLVALLSLTNAPADSKRWIRYQYDPLGRRTSQQVQIWTNAAWSVVSSNLFLYDGWNLVGEANATNKALVRSYVWGLDLSGSFQGAGGVGGLLQVTDWASPTARHWVAYDGNGNVMALADSTAGTHTARYEYGPFGETLRATGPMAKLNPFRFSTKHTDNDTGFLYYGYRFYNPPTGRWPNRDPLAERGGANLYGCVDNNLVNRFDALGLQALPVPVPPSPPIVVLPPPGAPPNIIPFPTPPPVVRPIGPPQVAACIAVAVGGWYLGDWIGEETGIHDGLGDVIGGIIAPPVIVGGATGTHPGSPFTAGSRDPLTLPRVNPGPCGKCGNGCKPCPPNSPAWEVNEPGHGSSTTHWHWIEYHQRPPTHPKFPCECVPIRQSSPTKPPGA